MDVAENDFPNRYSGGPAFDAGDVSPSNDTEITFRFLRVNSAGNITIKTAGGNDVTIAATAGEYIPLSGSKVYATGTTATGITWFR